LLNSPEFMESFLQGRVRLGNFELDLKSGELHCLATTDGAGKILLREQPFRVLRMLIEQSGKIVTREEIRKNLWPNDTIVDFDHSINAAIKTLRRALGDSADKPQYIETLARRGYRLMAAVEWLETSADVLAKPEASEQVFPGLGDLIGKKVSHYRVLEAIGGGGMGMVFKAEDLKLGRRVALKFLPEELASDPVALRRFEREAQTASALNHPNICTIYEIEEHEGQPFIVMELLEGENLHHRMAASEPTPFALASLLDIAMQVCDGLQAAHEKGIIHRDIKPANLFVTKQGPVKILDFGIAKLAESEDVEDKDATEMSEAAPTGSTNTARVHPIFTSLTRTGTTAGTAGYMSPEQVRKEKLDSRTDLFSFGLVLYQMAAGRRAFTGETVEAVHDAILNQTPVPAHDVNPAVPAALDDVISKALEKDRSRRYQSANDLRTDLKSLKQGEDSGPTAVVAVAAAVERRAISRWVWVTAGVALLLAAIAATVLLRPSRGKSVDAIAVLPFVNATNVADNEYLSDGITEDLINTLSELPNVKVVARSTVFRFKNKDEDPAKIGQELKVDAVLTGRVSQRNGELSIQTDLINTSDGTEMWGAQYSRSKPNLMTLRGDIVNDVAARLRAKVSGEQHEAMMKPDTFNSQAYDLYLKGRFAWNLRGGNNIRESIADYQQAIAADPAFALAYSGLADAYSVAPGYGVSTPRETHALALAAAAKALQLQPNLAEGHAAMAEALAHTRQWSAAEKEFKRSFELSPNNASAHYLYAHAYLVPMKRLDEATREYHKALEIDPLSPIINGNYGVLLFVQHKYDEAMKQMTQTMELQPSFTVTALRMSELLAIKGDFQNAAIQMHTYFPNLAIPEHADARSYGQATVDAIAKLTGYQPPYLTAEAWTWAGNRDKVFEYLRQGCVEEDHLEQVFLRSPSFDPIRSDPRYVEVTNCLTIPQ
jgi:eukaryotic-like serine/threonine-protein kinase